MVPVRGLIFGSLLAIAGVFLARDWGNIKPPAPPGFTVVQYWEKWTGSEAAQMRQIVDAFNDTIGREKRIFVQYMSMSAVDQKTLVAISAGVPPDIAGLWGEQVAQFAALGAVQPLDDLAAAYGVTEETYVPAYWEGCCYEGKLYALVSTPASIALHYNKESFNLAADRLRAAGLDPDRPPRTLEELDRYAAAIDLRDPHGHVDMAGYLPLQSWYVPFTCYWFGGDLFDPRTKQFQLTSEPCVKGYEWIQTYSKKLGVASVENFMSTHLLSNFDSPQNPFITGKLAMQQQGPWMANYINNLRPALSRVKVPKEQEHTLPRRTDNYGWAVAPFPSAIPGLENVTYCSFDSLMIPVGARHKTEAFEFIAYVNRQDVCERLNTLHCKNTQLRKVSRDFLTNHPNPYIDVFQALAASPNAKGLPPVPNWPEVAKELNDASQAVALQGADPRTILTAANRRLQAKYDRFYRIEAQRKRSSKELVVRVP